MYSFSVKLSQLKHIKCTNKINAVFVTHFTTKKLLDFLKRNNNLKASIKKIEKTPPNILDFKPKKNVFFMKT